MSEHQSSQNGEGAQFSSRELADVIGKLESLGTEGSAPRLVDMQEQVGKEFTERFGEQTEVVSKRAHELYESVSFHKGIIWKPNERPAVSEEHRRANVEATRKALAHPDSQATLAEFRAAQTDLAHEWWKQLEKEILSPGAEKLQSFLTENRLAPINNLEGLLKDFLGEANYDHSKVTNVIQVALARHAKAIAQRDDDTYDSAQELYLQMRELSQAAGMGTELDPLNTVGKAAGELREIADFNGLFGIMKDPLFGYEDSDIVTKFDRLIFVPDRLADITITEPALSTSIN